MNPNTNPITNPVGQNDLIRLVQEGYASLATIAQLAAALGVGGGVFGLKSPGVLAQSAVPTSVTGTTAETVLATIPYSAWDVNTALRIDGSFTGTDSTSRTFYFRANGVLIGSVTMSSQSTDFMFKMANRGGVKSQYTSVVFWTSAGTFVRSVFTTAIDLSVAGSLTISVANSSTTQTEQLEAFTALLTNP